MKFFTRNLFGISSFLIMVIMSLMLYPGLPDDLPAGFSMAGELLRTQSKDVVAPLTPGIFLGILLITNVVIGISPQRFTMPNSKRAMDTILGGIGVQCCFLHFALLMNGGDFDFFVRYFSYGMALFLVIVGNVWGKTERNFILGLRLPWTITSEANWRATHRFGGRLCVVSGALLLISNSLLANLWLTITLLSLPLLIPVIYSYTYYAKYERDAQAKEEAGQF